MVIWPGTGLPLAAPLGLGDGSSEAMGIALAFCSTIEASGETLGVTLEVVLWLHAPSMTVDKANSKTFFITPLAAEQV